MKSASIQQWVPGLHQLKNYDRSWLKDDIRAAVSVVAVALPVAIAYAQLTGVSAIVGLYSCILPMIVYALFGTSRQLIVGPDAATCAVVAAVVTPLAGGDPIRHMELVTVMTLMTGGWCILASRFKLGILADFLSRPILIGLLNGVALTIIFGQLVKFIGIKNSEEFLLQNVIDTPWIIFDVHWQTVAISVVTAVIYFGFKKFQPSSPAAMISICVASLLVWFFQLDEQGVKVIGSIQGGLPTLHVPNIEVTTLRELVMPALNLAMVSFVSMMLTARSFAAKNGYEIDADKEFQALGLANLASAFSQGFAISGADSRTAVNDANGGKSQMVSIIAALLVAVIAIFVYEPLRYIPIAALGVVLIIAATSLVDLSGIWQMRVRNKDAFYLAMITFVGVLVIGVIPGITMAVLLGLVQFLRVIMRPTDELLGLDKEGTVRALDSSDKASPIPGLTIYRFNSPLTYFNSPYFKRRVLDHSEAAAPEEKCFIIDAVSCFTHFDLSVMATLADVHNILKSRGIRLVVAGRKPSMRKWCELSGIPVGDGGLVLRADMFVAIKLSGCYFNAVGEGHIPEIQKEPESSVEDIRVAPSVA
ncbi:sodium-independent anion transporter [Vibrio diazotrophicus]|uniref:Sodium-independent anion transporter n=1 Tax=Vibrio diazotrophicus TaxID=685 RepID=A0A2J8I801_VIBDI|nr:SulP family inorganic anion transporter [Vibrio diazotrophicus]PNI06662.1 sodium-independent anion transporter [Vibrio diazotrophicus]